MEFNRIVYPAHKCSSYNSMHDNILPEELIYVPRSDGKAIPCLYLPSENKKFLIYFHGNAEDIVASYELATHL